MAWKGFEDLTEDQIVQRNARIGQSPAAKFSADVAAITNPKPSKYRNVKTEIDGERFDSKREAEHWLLLRERERCGEITNLRRQVPIELLAPILVGFVDITTARAVVAHYVADFVYEDRDGRSHVVDAKGHRTALYRLKAKWLILQSGVIIEEV